ncbi:hypothetical protein D3C78_1161310 [compost metagenome]
MCALRRGGLTLTALDQATAPGDIHQFHQRGRLQLLHQAHLVGADGLVADRQLLADRDIAEAARQQLQDREFTHR